MTTIAIVGAGFCGTVLAVRLLRGASVGALSIVLIDHGDAPTRGLAYGVRSDTALLNVPAGQMSAFPEWPDDFLRFARTRDPRTQPWHFLPRRLYGDYLEWLFTGAVGAATDGRRLRMIRAYARRLEPGPRSTRLRLSDGGVVDADHVVLASGHEAPADPPLAPGCRGFYASRRYIADPWAREAWASVDPEQPVLIVGSSLTMLDVVLELRERGFASPVHVLSRRGLVPQAHRGDEGPPRYASDLSARLLQRGRLRHYVRALRDEVDKAALAGYDWRDVLYTLRPATPALWQALPVVEQRRFLRHLRPYWDVHRHRCAPQVWRRFEAERQAGGLSLLAGTLVDLRDTGSEVAVSYRPRRQSRTRELRVGSVINCTGPAARMDQTRDPLLGQLLADGTLAPEGLGIGIRLDEHFTPVGADGRRAMSLSYVGPMLRAQQWEAIAVPELRVHVRQLAEHLEQTLLRCRRVRRDPPQSAQPTGRADAPYVPDPS